MFRSTPAAGWKAVALRLPMVMVPVLSSNSTSMSPAVSTALPLLVITLARSARSMPAMPMALNNPPIVVGIRHTKSETSAAMVTVAFAYPAKGCSVTHTMMNTSVKPASRMVSAISFGVFWRLAPSTSAIMRSRKLSPGSLVTRTFTRSLSTFVPPVTELLSPPASRITGALSPVMALSSMVARPSMISPSVAIRSPASQTNTSPLRRSLEERSVIFPSAPTTFAGVSSRVFRSELACAFPRASAMASAKLAKSKVRKSSRKTATL